MVFGHTKSTLTHIDLGMETYLISHYAAKWTHFANTLNKQTNFFFASFRHPNFPLYLLVSYDPSFVGTSTFDRTKKKKK